MSDQREPAIQGHLDGIRDGRIVGWALIDGRPDLNVTAFIDGSPVSSAVADEMRWDLVQAGIGNGRHGFHLSIPGKLQFHQDSVLSVSAEGTAFGEAKPIANFLADRSVSFGPTGMRVTSTTAPAEALETFRALRADPVVSPIYNAEMASYVDALLGRYTDTFNLDRVAALMASVDSARYAEQHMRNAARFGDAHANLRASVALVTQPGLFLEFGVFSATSLNIIARERPDVTIHGFDSFEGLPETWDGVAPKGTFAVAKIPLVAQNSELHIGWFDQTLPTFAANHGGQKAAFIHVDCDLYSSTKTIFDNIVNMIVPGTIIVFDEYFNYPGWQRHEYAAFHELILRASLGYEYVSFVPNHKQVTVRICALNDGDVH